MRSIFLVTLVSIAIFVFQANANALFKNTKFTVLVLSEEGEPVPGIRVGVGLEKNTRWGTDSSGQTGISGADGKTTFTGQSNGHITYGGSKDGYYPSYYDYDFEDLGTFGWEPWNPELKIVMRKIVDPVPMYARNAKFSKLTIPVIGKEVGFDLIAVDWMPPYGKGLHADFIFYQEKRVASWRDYDAMVRITFSNRKDGIIKINEDLQNGSEFKLPRFAPESGYENNLLIQQRNRPGKAWISGFDRNDNFIFRIRSQEKDGKIISAMYGKIIGPIEIGPTKDPTGLYFKYYLNPDGTRNLEFDPDRNLFKDLSSMERVGIK